MRPVWLHSWDVDPAMARQIQQEASRRVILQDDPAVCVLPERIVALDVGYDGQGIAHPRRLGLASHLGVLYDCVCPIFARMGQMLADGHAWPSGDGSGGGDRELWAPRKKDEQIGWVLRSRTHVSSTYVSPGPRVSMAKALALARAMLGRYRLADPVRGSRTN